MKKLIWIGNRQSELYGIEDKFDLNITKWGNNIYPNISARKELNEVELNNEYKYFIYKKITELNDDNIEVLFYSPALAYKLIDIYPEFKRFCICLNSINILNILYNKIYTRAWLSNYINAPNYVTLVGQEIDINILKKNFHGYDQFVIQEKISAGGTGTYLMNSNNDQKVKQNLKEDEIYLISPYFESVSINVHVLIANGEYIIFPPSVQIIEKRNEKLIYVGADFAAFNYIDEKLKEKIYDSSQIIAKLLLHKKYTGVLGIDYIISKDEVYFIEINPRFQASTLLLNLELKKCGLPSIHELNIIAFKENKLINKHEIEKMKINYSFYKYADELFKDLEKYNFYLKLHNLCTETEAILLDGYNGTELKDNKYQYSVVIRDHILSVDDYCHPHIHPNFTSTSFSFHTQPSSLSMHELINLKFALLNQGVRIEENASQQLKKMGGYNKSVYSSIDFWIEELYRVNSPINTRFTGLSPFSIIYNGTFKLTYFGKIICSIKIELSKDINILTTQEGTPYSRIGFISGDRLRIKPENSCYFKSLGKGCLFCPGNKTYSSKYNLSEIYEVIDYCINNEAIRHILVGGGTANPNEDGDRFLEVIKYIGSKTNKPIYLMATPPSSIEKIKQYVELGVKEIAFNIELYDRKLAQYYMPEKGKISLEYYFECLKYATQFLGKTGNVRSMLMVGIEKKDNTLKCVDMLAKNGIQPMLSAFRPTLNCKLNHIVPLSTEELLGIYYDADAICQQYNISLGPNCPICQNNTLSFKL